MVRFIERRTNELLGPFGSLAPGCGPMGVLGMLAARCNRLLTKSEKRIPAATCCRDFRAHWETQFLPVAAEVSIVGGNVAGPL